MYTSVPPRTAFKGDVCSDPLGDWSCNHILILQERHRQWSFVRPHHSLGWIGTQVIDWSLTKCVPHKQYFNHQARYNKTRDFSLISLPVQMSTWSSIILSERLMNSCGVGSNTRSVMWTKLQAITSKFWKHTWVFARLVVLDWAWLYIFWLGCMSHSVHPG